MPPIICFGLQIYIRLLYNFIVTIKNILGSTIFENTAFKNNRHPHNYCVEKKKKQTAVNLFMKCFNKAEDTSASATEGI